MKIYNKGKGIKITKIWYKDYKTKKELIFEISSGGEEEFLIQSGSEIENYCRFIKIEGQKRFLIEDNTRQIEKKVKEKEGDCNFSDYIFLTNPNFSGLIFKKKLILKMYFSYIQPILKEQYLKIKLISQKQYLKIL